MSNYLNISVSVCTCAWYVQTSLNQTCWNRNCNGSPKLRQGSSSSLLQLCNKLCKYRKTFSVLLRKVFSNTENSTSIYIFCAPIFSLFSMYQHTSALPGVCHCWAFVGIVLLPEVLFLFLFFFLLCNLTYLVHFKCPESSLSLPPPPKFIITSLGSKSFTYFILPDIMVRCWKRTSKTVEKEQALEIQRRFKWGKILAEKCWASYWVFFSLCFSFFKMNTIINLLVFVSILMSKYR